MKRINAYKKLFQVEGNIELKPLKSTYRQLVKEWHPDKFQSGDPMAEEAELKSQEIIDGYHFLVSIAPETKEAQLEDYTKTITESGLADFQHKGQLLEVTFMDGSTYEYFGVNKKLYLKFLNSDKQLRFAKRNIFSSFLYRKSKKEMKAETAAQA
ncbi:MAG: KTSC domain-containing protein [Flavobacteriales bacterium]